MVILIMGSSKSGNSSDFAAKSQNQDLSHVVSQLKTLVWQSQRCFTVAKSLETSQSLEVQGSVIRNGTTIPDTTNNLFCLDGPKCRQAWPEVEVHKLVVGPCHCRSSRHFSRTTTDHAGNGQATAENDQDTWQGFRKYISVNETEWEKYDETITSKKKEKQQTLQTQCYCSTVRDWAEDYQHQVKHIIKTAITTTNLVAVLRHLKPAPNIYSRMRDTQYWFNKKPSNCLGQAKRHAFKIRPNATVAAVFSNFNNCRSELADEVISGISVKNLSVS